MTRSLSSTKRKIPCRFKSAGDLFSWLKISVLGAGGEAGAVFGYVGKLAMAYDASLRVVAMQLLQEFVE
jgi:hypothetical protein